MRTFAQFRAFIRAVTRKSAASDGIALVLLAGGVIVFCGFVAMSIDVGRLVWARTQMQAAVDAAALAGGQSLPSQAAAQNTAVTYYQENATFITDADPSSSTPNVTFPSARSLTVEGNAQIPTWFARLFGIDNWDVSATGTAETITLDTMIVMDRSGSMCWEKFQNYHSNFAFDETVDEGEDDIRIRFINGASTMSQVVYVGQEFYVNRSGTDEWMEVLQIISPNRIIVDRDINNNFGGDGPSSSYSSSSSIRGNTCQTAGPGPYEPWASVNYAASLFPTKLSAGYDRVGYVPYSTNGDFHTPLSTNLNGVRSSILSAPDPTAGGVPDQLTNISNGLGIANAELVANGRVTADFVIILVTDGVGNSYCTGNPQVDNCSSAQSESNSESQTRAEAQWAADHGIRIYTIGYGWSGNFDEDLLEDIAALTGGVYYPAPDDAAVDAAFTEIADIIRVRLSN